MSLDFTQIDEVIQTLQKKSIGFSSPPVSLKGHLGIWRTIRGFRTFLELLPGGGADSRYKFDGKSFTAGRVLVGPPSLVNQNIGSVPEHVWSGLSGSGTNEIFSAPNGTSTLKSSIKNSLGPEDTRRAAIDATDDLPKLVQIARSAGYQDSEIKQALGGKVFQDALGSNVVSLADHKDKKPSNELPKDLPAASGLDSVPLPTPSPHTPPTPGKMTADGALAPMIDALKIPGIISTDKKRAAADRLSESAKKLQDQFLRKQVETLANGLRTNDFKLEDVKDEIKALIQHRTSSLMGKMSEQDMSKLADKVAAKDAVQEIKARVEATPDPTPVQVKEDAQHYAAALSQLASQISDPKVVVEIKAVQAEAKAGKTSGKNLLLRLLRILRIILAFIPGIG